jgi:hypothetical protein
MSLTLKSVESRAGHLLAAKYSLAHSTPGRDGTVLEQTLSLQILPGETTAYLTIPDCKATTPDEALTRLATWLRRLADGIDQRSTSISLPLT